MPRKPTGRPTGRPVGSGTLGETHTRLTVRLPAELYARLAAFAAGRSYPRGTPQLAGCVRALLEHALACPHTRQRGHGPPEMLDDVAREALPLTSQPHPVEVPVLLRPVPPGHYLGAPCSVQGHVSHGTTPGGEPQTLRNPGGKCVLCEEQKKARTAPRQTVGGQEP